VVTVAFTDLLSLSLSLSLFLSHSHRALRVHAVRVTRPTECPDFHEGSHSSPLLLLSCRFVCHRSRNKRERERSGAYGVSLLASIPRLRGQRERERERERESRAVIMEIEIPFEPCVRSFLLLSRFRPPRSCSHSRLLIRARSR